jgi:hypothetical protein
MSRAEELTEEQWAVIEHLFRELQPRWVEMGVVPPGGSPGDAEKFFASERAKWNNVIKVAGIRGD